MRCGLPGTGRTICLLVGRSIDCPAASRAPRDRTMKTASHLRVMSTHYQLPACAALQKSYIRSSARLVALNQHSKNKLNATLRTRRTTMSPSLISPEEILPEHSEVSSEPGVSTAARAAKKVREDLRMGRAYQEGRIN